ncbi:MAG: aldo/keto reductase [Candidatus Neomarinimicrobiota bacterium]
MEYTILGRTGVKVPRISLGTWSYGGAAESHGLGVGWANQIDADSRNALTAAFDSGINHWDTADVYGSGRSEKIIGSMWSDIPRQDIFLATKVGWDMGPEKHWYHPRYMRKKMEESLINLKTECVDLMYLHHCNFGEKGEFFDDALEEVRRFQEEGKTRFLGLSDWSHTKILNFIKAADPDVIQPYRNVMDDNYLSSGLKDYVEKNNLGVCFFSPLKHGLLTGKYTEVPKFEKGDFRQTIKAFKKPDLIKKMQVNKALLENHFAPHPEPVLRGLVDALLTNVSGGCVLLGQRNLKQVKSAAALGQDLSQEDAAWVGELYGKSDA